MSEPIPVRRLSVLWLAAALLCQGLVLPRIASAQELERVPVAAAPDPLEARLQALQARVVRDAADPRVAADLYELEDLVRQGGSLERTAEALHQVTRARGVDAEVRALAHRILADVQRMRGRLPRMEQSLAAIGSLRDFAFVGPFDDDNDTGHDRIHGPEQNLDLGASYDGLRGEVRWRRVEDLGRTGTVVLREAVRPTSSVVVYALTSIHVPRATEALLYLGTPGATKAWLGGRPILNDPDRHPARFDQTAIPIRLERGSNLLLLKLSAGTVGPLELHARVVAPNGRPIRGLTAQAPAAGTFATPSQARGILKGRRPLVDRLERLAAGGEERSLYAFARVLNERRPFDRNVRPHEKAAARAAHAAPLHVEAQFLAAATADDPNEARLFLERAARAERPGEARAHAALARYWRGSGDAFRALRLLQDRMEAARGDWRAALLLADLYDGQGFQSRAIRIVEELASRHPEEPQVLEALARHRLRERRNDEAERLYRVVLAHRPASLGAAASLASLLVDRGAIEEADQVLANAAQLGAPDLQGRIRRADVLAANGFEQRASTLYESAIALNPQEAEVFERAAQTALRAGRRDEALARFERALATRPQDARLQEMVRSLRPEGHAFATPWLHDLTEVAAAAGTWEGEDAVRLVHLQAIRVLPSGQASRTRQSIVRVQTQRGVERFRSTPIRYAPDREEVRVERARILKPDGSIVDAHAEHERAMNEAWSGMYFDTRTRVVSFPSLAVGDVLELVYSVDDVGRDNLLGDYFGDVSFLADTVPTGHWEYVLAMPAGRSIHTNEIPAAYEELPGEEGGRIHRWVARDLPRLQPEPHMPGWSEVATYLHVSTYASWEQVARFWWELIRDQIQPTPTIEALARQVVEDIPASDVEGRVRAVYGWVVENTRYVGLEFGIHGFKPYHVDQVIRRGFGDCKDKAALIWSMLRSLGIDSNMVLLRMRHLGTMGEHPASLAVFNHAIVYVPSLDLWLDGTAEWSGSNELPASDRGAEVLVVDPDGTSLYGKVPEAPASLSVTSSRHQVRLHEDGSALIDGESRIGGIPAPRYRRAYASPAGRTASFEQAWARTFPGVTVTRLDMSDPAHIEEQVELAFDMRVPRYADPTGDGGLAFRPLGRGRTWVEAHAPLSSRTLPLVLDHAFENRFAYDYHLPAGFEVERLPRTGEVRSDFGRASLQVQEVEGVLQVRAEVAIETPRIEAADYPAFRAFLGEVDALFGGRIHLRPGGADL